ncbi:glycosyltransferase family 2 protein [Aquibacillus sediminis]|uniref:glycosyltransferase family 2 protein n=1 Tax=Aquibacillus sediminis TaxID=2574734 RepID=UPI0011096007|nr:glycosyltransferase [Aquibacillus sediminis]
MRLLKTESEIIQKWNGELTSPPHVSICCITYNHERYIEDALEGFLMQETDFSFEILVHDDASTDNTANIIREYHDKYPNIIKPIIQTENQYSRGIRPNLEYNFFRAKGKYIALCEGDDYWIDKYKLQKQVNILDSNQYIAVTHNVNTVDENGMLLEFKTYKKITSPKVFTIKEAQKILLPGQTASVVYRNIWSELDSEIIRLYRKCSANGDQKNAVLYALLGDIYCMTDCMAVHRRIVTHGDSWSARNYKKDLSIKLYRTLLDINEFALKGFGVQLENKEKRMDIIIGSFMKLMRKPSKENLKIFQKLLELNIDTYHGLIIRFVYKLYYKLAQKFIIRKAA